MLGRCNDGKALGEATASVRGETDQESIAKQDDHGYYNVDGSYIGVQSNNGMVYYLPGNNLYVSGTLMGADG